MVSVASLKLLALGSLTLGITGIYYGISNYHSAILNVLAASLICVGLVLLDILSLEPTPSHSVKTLIVQYVVVRLLKLLCTLAWRSYEKAFQRCQETQVRTLKAILKQNHNTRFCRDRKLCEQIDIDSFRKVMPITTYDDYRQYIDSILNEDPKDVLVPGKPTFVAFTSGTTSGKSKPFPRKHPFLNALMYTIGFWMDLCGKWLKKWCLVLVNADIKQTRSGIDSGPVSRFMTTSVAKLPFIVYPETDIKTEKEALYVCALFAIKEDVRCILSTVSVHALSFFTTMENNWQSLCDDIEKGTVSESLNISEEDRQVINEHLSADPGRARELRAIFKDGIANVAKRIWTKPTLLATSTGTFASAAKAVSERYTGGKALFTVSHIASEGVYGVSPALSSQNVCFCPTIKDIFFEFLPIADGQTAHPLLAHQVSIGKHYELVVTTFDGLYRYRTEDQVCIRDFRGSTPVYEFIGRTCDVLCATTWKTPEFLVRGSLQAVAERKKISVKDMVCTEAINLHLAEGTVPVHDNKYYVIFLELETGVKLDAEVEGQVDEELKARDEFYAEQRGNESLKPIRIFQVKQGSFLLVKEVILSTNPKASPNQYKPPRVTRRVDVLKCLLKNFESY